MDEKNTSSSLYCTCFYLEFVSLLFYVVIFSLRGRSKCYLLMIVNKPPKLGVRFARTLYPPQTPLVELHWIYCCCCLITRSVSFIISFMKKHLTTNFLFGSTWSWLSNRFKRRKKSKQVQTKTYKSEDTHSPVTVQLQKPQPEKFSWCQQDSWSESCQ